MTVLLKSIVQIPDGNLVCYAIPLWIVLFAVTVYHMRNKGTMGFLMAFGEIIAMLLIFVFFYEVTMPGVFVWLGACFVIVLYVLKKDWFGCDKRWGFAFLACPIMLLAFIIGHPHRIERLKFLFAPDAELGGYAYIPAQIYDILQNASLIGAGNLNLSYVVEHLYNANVVHTNYILTAALSHWGWISVLLIIACYVCLFVFCAQASFKVKSQMGKLVMLSITTGWILQVVNYLIINFTTLQMSTYPLLFVQGTWMQMINLFLLGILLSVYKTGAVQKDTESVIANKSAVSEKESKFFYG